MNLTPGCDHDHLPNPPSVARRQAITMIHRLPQVSSTIFQHALILTLVMFGLVRQLHGQSWRSTLYPQNWQRPAETSSFYNDMFVQDFSYAGYKRGEEPLPVINGPVFDAVTYGADASGTIDSTAAIQSAIHAAQAAGGGVVYLPAGLYRISPQDGNNHCLRISASNIVLRGAGAASTRLLNTSTEMRGKKVLLIQPSSVSNGAEVGLTADLDGPTRRLPVADPGAFTPGDMIRLQWTFTADWIAEHNQQTWWSASNGPADAQYLRQVVAINPAEGWIEVDVPTRYTMKTRDNARVMKRTGMLSGIGIESLALGNLQIAGTSWGENEYTDSTKPAYQAHASYLLDMRDTHDSWITGIESFQPNGNTSTCHMLSNGILVQGCTRVTLSDCSMSRPQYGGGGGNGYMYRLSYSNECLVRDCVADFSRHGIVVSLAGTSGNVFLHCEDRETQRATGHTGSYQTSGSGSDNHMHFSHSNLWDGCTAHNSFYTAHHRTNSGTIPHGLTSAHSVYWNTSGTGSRGGAVVRSEQARYGYVIGTSGERPSVSNPTGGNTAPADLVEGVGIGTTLEPTSLYLDQWSRRLEPRLSLAGETIRFPDNSFAVDATITLDGEPLTSPSDLDWNVTNSPAGASIYWVATPNGRTFSVSHPGSYVIEASGTHQGEFFQNSLTIEVLPPETAAPTIELPAVADSHVQSGTGAALNFGSSASLALKNDGGANVEREAFMRFDLSEIDTSAIAEATLHLHFTSTGIDATGRTSVVNDSSNWQEMSINWNTRPTLQKAIVGDWTPAPADWRILDTTSVISSGLESNGTITFRHQILSQASNTLYYIASREHGDPSLRPFLRLRMPSQSLAAWLTETSGLAEPDLDPDDDPDGDGIANLLEAWLGTQAGQSDSSAMPSFALRNGQMEFNLQINANPPAGLFYFLEFSNNLDGDWQPAPNVVWESAGPVVNGRQPMSARVTHDPSIHQRFYRFMVLTP